MTHQFFSYSGAFNYPEAWGGKAPVFHGTDAAGDKHYVALCEDNAAQFKAVNKLKAVVLTDDLRDYLLANSPALKGGGKGGRANDPAWFQERGIMRPGDEPIVVQVERGRLNNQPLPGQPAA